MQGKFIKIQLTAISKSYLKLNFRFPNKIIYVIRSKSLQINNFLLNNQTFR